MKIAYFIDTKILHFLAPITVQISCTHLQYSQPEELLTKQQVGICYKGQHPIDIHHLVGELWITNQQHWQWAQTNWQLFCVFCNSCG